MGLKFDGKYLKNNGKTLATVSGSYIKEGSGGRRIADMDDVRDDIDGIKKL